MWDCLRCIYCKRIWLESWILKLGGCSCGSNKVAPTYPISVLEELRVIYQMLRFKWRVRHEPSID
jgi:hypothetical protein